MPSIIDKLKSKLYLHQIKCIVWDYDGTLYNPQDSKLIGQKLEKNFFCISRKYHKKLEIQEFKNKSELLGSWADATNYYSSIPIFKILDMVSNQFNKEKYIKPNPKIVNFIEKTKDEYTHIILTNATTTEVLNGLVKIGFKKNVFKKIFSRDITNKLKPDNKLLEGIQKFTKLNKKNHLFIGDSMKIDIEPAKKLGFKAIPIWDIDKIFHNL